MNWTLLLFLLRARAMMANKQIDRLSDLPDCLIYQILSFLDTQQAIQTCVLSKRWRSLSWASLPNLMFQDFTVCQYTKDFTYSSTLNNFIPKVLSARDDCRVHKLQIRSAWHLDHSILNSLINYAVSYHVQHLHLCFYSIFRFNFTLPPALLTCKSLETLSLTRLDFDSLPNFSLCLSAFTNLTSLNFSWCRFRFFSSTFFSCPNLKNLCLYYCEFWPSQVEKISGLQLVNLEIVGVRIDFINRVEFCAPKLTSFTYKYSDAIDFSVLDLPSLNHADISICDSYRFGKFALNETNGSMALINLLRGLHNAQFISLDYQTIMILDSVLDLQAENPSPFKKLKSLKMLCLVLSSNKIPTKVLTYFLNGAFYEKSIIVGGPADGKTIHMVLRKASDGHTDATGGVAEKDEGGPSLTLDDIVLHDIDLYDLYSFIPRY